MNQILMRMNKISIKINQNQALIQSYQLSINTNIEQRIMISHHYDFDRFIPQKTNQPILCNTYIKKNQSFYSNYIKENICPTTRVLNFHHKENIEVNHSKNFQDMKINFNFICEKETYTKNTWSNKKITFSQLLSSSEPQKILDVPGTKDDFYLNTLDWSPSGPLGIGIDNQAFLYTPSNITEVCKIFDGSYISSLKFNQSTVSLGFSDGKVRIYDIETASLVREIHEHQKRVSALSFGSNNLMYTGSKDRNILVNDLRIRDATINRLNVHRGQICALSCQPQIGNYLASGSNDNWVAIWDLRRHQLYRKYTEHKGAIKAIDWCPWKTGVIATAGGAGDKTIRIWNIQESQDLSLKRTQTQISSVVWNEQSGLLISSHGHPNNEINFWSPEVVSNKALSLQKVKTLKGHTGRVLNLAVSPSHTMICSLSSDQTLRFWNFLQCEEAWKPQKQLKSCNWSLNLK